MPRACYIGKFEVTQAQWKKVMGTNPALFQGGRVTDDGDKHPVESITWEDAQSFYNEKIFADPTPAETGKVHVLKGGGFLADVKNAIRGNSRGRSKFDVGFRIVRG